MVSPSLTGSTYRVKHFMPFFASASLKLLILSVIILLDSLMYCYWWWGRLQDDNPLKQIILLQINGSLNLLISPVCLCEFYDGNTFFTFFLAINSVERVFCCFLTLKQWQLKDCDFWQNICNLWCFYSWLNRINLQVWSSILKQFI